MSQPIESDNSSQELAAGKSNDLIPESEKLESQVELRVRAIKSILSPILYETGSIGPEGVQALIHATLRDEFRSWLTDAVTHHADEYSVCSTIKQPTFERHRRVLPRFGNGETTLWIPSIALSNDHYGASYFGATDGQGKEHDYVETIDISFEEDATPRLALRLRGDTVSRTSERQAYTFGFYPTGHILVQIGNHFGFIIDKNGTILSSDEVNEWTQSKDWKPIEGVGSSYESSSSQRKLLVRKELPQLENPQEDK